MPAIKLPRCPTVVAVLSAKREEGKMITKSERAELRSVVRQQMKVLRSEVKQREVEMVAEIDAQIANQYAEADSIAKDVFDSIRAIVEGANQSIREVVATSGNNRWRNCDLLQVPYLLRSDERRRAVLRQAAMSELKSKVQTATLRLDRTEADLLRQLSLDALESGEAKAFLSSIPSVSELVPVVRLAELEASLGEQ
jgi:hypothetical protein